MTKLGETPLKKEKKNDNSHEGLRYAPDTRTKPRTPIHTLFTHTLLCIHSQRQSAGAAAGLGGDIPHDRSGGYGG